MSVGKPVLVEAKDWNAILARLEALEAISIPSGTIAIWSGSEATIPTGWVICDGTESTPDLTDKFVMGAGNSYAVDAEGGSASHQHNTIVGFDNGRLQNINLNEFGGWAHSPGTGWSYHTANGTGSSQFSASKTSSTSSLSPYYALAYIMKT